MQIITIYSQKHKPDIQGKQSHSLDTMYLFQTKYGGIQEYPRIQFVEAKK